MTKTSPAVNPFASGPGGTNFELLVAEFYLAAMLKGELPLGYEDGGLISSVKLQQRNKDNPVDDIVIKTDKGSLSIQVKHRIIFSNKISTSNGKPSAIYDALSQCWALYNDIKFQKGIDRFGIAFNVMSFSTNSRTDIGNTINWAKTEISSEEYLIQLTKFKGKSKIFSMFRDLLTEISKSPIDEETTWHFLRHLVLLPFDFSETPSYNFNELLNKLITICKVRSAENAQILHTAFYILATDYAIAGGEVDTYSLEKRLPQEIYAPITNQQTVYSIRKNLALQLEQKIAREKNSKKYIPDVFVELPQVKDELRYFSDPILFIAKLINRLDKIDSEPYNQLASKLNFPHIDIKLPEAFQSPDTLQDAIIASNMIEKFIVGRIADLEKLDPYKGKEVSQYVNASNNALFEELSHPLWNSLHHIIRELKTAARHFDLLSAQILIIEGKAASGKTNFICNFADTTLKGSQQTTLYVTGYDLSAEATTISLKNRIIGQFSEDYNDKISPLFSDIEKICSVDRKPILVIIEGINEHPNLMNFSKQLEQVLAEFTSSINIRFILTCRSEYFDKRFENLKTASFSDKVQIIEILTRDIAPIHKRYMIAAYFRHFKIRCHLSNKVRDIFVNNPLVLRLFSEAYGAVDNKAVITLGPLNDINLDVLFDKYNNKIEENFEKQYPDSNFKRRYRRLLNDLAEYMIENNIFSNVPVASISNESYEVIIDLVNDGVILRKDITESPITEDSEVLNFTFDEFRDYILTDYLLKKFDPGDPQEFNEIYSKLVSPDSPVAEGLGKYSFFAARRRIDSPILTNLKTLGNYDDIFLKNIFSVDEGSISQKDLEEIDRLFHKNSQSAEQIFFGVLNRRSRIDFPVLNVWVFLDLVARLNEKDYLRLISPIFSSHFERIDDICDSIKSIISSCNTRTIRSDWNSSLIEILICLSPILPIPARFSGKIVPINLLLDIADTHPKLTISLIKKYLDNPNSRIAQEIWVGIAYSRADIFFEKEISGIAEKIRNHSSINSNSTFSRALNHYISEYGEYMNSRN